MAQLPTGFKNLPVSRYLIYLTAIVPLISSLASTKYVFYLSYTPFISDYGQFWRIITSHTSFINESEVLLSVIILYQHRALERFFSSYKYVSLLLVIWVYNVIVTLLLVILDFYFQGFFIPINRFPSGPFGVMTAIYAIYKNYIPVTYTFDIYLSEDRRITLNDQIVLNLLTLQLIISQGWCSIFMGFTGYVIGVLLTNGILPGKNWRIPFYGFITGSLFSPKVQNRPTNSTGNNSINNRSGTSNDEDEEATQDRDEGEDPAETRPLTSQFLDTFRR